MVTTAAVGGTVADVEAAVAVGAMLGGTVTLLIDADGVGTVAGAVVALWMVPVVDASSLIVDTLNILFSLVTTT